MTISVSVTSDKLSKLGNDIEEFVLEESQELYDELYENIRSDNPVDTGLSKRSWTKAKEVKNVGDEGVIANDQDYVVWLEEGSSTQAPSGFIRTNIIRSLNKRQ